MDFKSGFIAIIGKPNVGKSSLINAIIGQKVCITSPKPQTTRNKILGIYNTPNCQMIFVDTPGVQNGQSALGKYLSKATKSGTAGADAIVILLDASRITATDYKIIEGYKNCKVPVYVVINKIDLSSYEKLYPILAMLNKYTFVKQFFTISALKHKNLDKLVTELQNCLPVGEPLYPTDTYTDRPLIFMASEIIREKALLFLQQEIPHGVAVEIDKYVESSSTIISASIICLSQRHKQIIIGAGGAMLKRIGESSRQELENLTGTKVVLKLFVKVRSNWQNDKSALSSLGYNSQEI